MQRIFILARLLGSHLDCLPIAVQHVLNDHTGVIDLDDLILSFHDVTLPGHEYFTFISKKYSLGLAGLAGEAVKLERDWRWRRRWRRCGRRFRPIWLPHTRNG